MVVSQDDYIGIGCVVGILIIIVFMIYGLHWIFALIAGIIAGLCIIISELRKVISRLERENERLKDGI